MGILMKNGVPYAGGSEIPEGGTKGQVLAKASNISGDFEWKDAGGSGNSSVQLTPGTSNKEIAVSDGNGNKLTVALNDNGKIKLRTESPMLFGVDKYLQEEAVIFEVGKVYTYDDFYDVINNHKAAYIVGYDEIETILYIECYMEGAMIYSTNGWAIKTYSWANNGSGDYKLEIGQTKSIAFSSDVFKSYRLGPSYKYNFNDVYNDTINLSNAVYITNGQGNKILISSTRHEGTLGTANSAIVCYGTDGNTIYTFRMAQNLDPDDNTSYFTEATRDTNVITAPNGDMFRIKVANDGTLSTEKVV